MVLLMAMVTVAEESDGYDYGFESDPLLGVAAERLPPFSVCGACVAYVVINGLRCWYLRFAILRVVGGLDENEVYVRVVIIDRCLCRNELANSHGHIQTQTNRHMRREKKRLKGRKWQVRK